MITRLEYKSTFFMLDDLWQRPRSRNDNGNAERQRFYAHITEGFSPNRWHDEHVD
jgi:hypothetical protein